MNNRFKQFNWIAFFIMHLFIFSQIAGAQGDIYLAGLYAEEVKGDLEKALSCYQQIIRHYSENHMFAARALLHIGLCYEKLGRPNKAFQAYKKIVSEYPEPLEISKLAMDKIARMEKRAPVNVLAKYYFERTGIDPLSATSYNSQYLAYTDWTSGNLTIRNIMTNEIKELTHTSWEVSPEYAVQPVWSHDDKFIAFSWFREPAFLELRTISLTDRTIETIYSDSNLYIYPQDWSPDGGSIICEVYDFRQSPPNFMALISLSDHQMKKLFPSSENSRGYMFSPDGKYITYDLLGKAGRQIMAFSLADSVITQITKINIGQFGFDNPVWSEDGRLLLYRSRRMGKFDLWASPVRQGKPAGEPFLVQPDMPQLPLMLKSININDYRAQSIEHHLRRKPVGQSISEDFTNTALDTAWFVFTWDKPNIYDYRDIGRYSLIEHPGCLRYYLAPGTHIAYHYNYLPHFSNWYWYYPAMEIGRAFSGHHWRLETRMTFYMPPGANTRGISFTIFFMDSSGVVASLIIQRKSGFPHYKGLGVYFQSGGIVQLKNENGLSPHDLPMDDTFTYTFRIERKGHSVTVAISDGEQNFRTILTAALNQAVTITRQAITLTSECWFAPAGSYVDWDYVHVTPTAAE